MLHPKEEVLRPNNEDSGSSRQQVEFESNIPSKSGQQIRVGTSETDEDILDTQQAQPYSITKDRSKRTIKPPARFSHSDFAYCLAVAEEVDSNEPRNYLEAITCAESSQWSIAMTEEIESLHKNQTWDLVKLPRDKKTVGCKWIFKKKEGIPGVEDARYKARLVAKGYSQKEGIDFNEVFSPVVKYTSIRVLLVMVAMYDMELEQLDVKTAFLHGDLEEVIYMD
uniref:Retrovirus-related Pol polyprotein from transposon TNT 1-94 n=1 Tax=Rhizophora mucronata TaxID=61149 RepID=A0A2P2MIR7_RHIMU